MTTTDPCLPVRDERELVLLLRGEALRLVREAVQELGLPPVTVEALVEEVAQDDEIYDNFLVNVTCEERPLTTEEGEAVAARVAQAIPSFLLFLVPFSVEVPAGHLMEPLF